PVEEPAGALEAAGGTPVEEPGTYPDEPADAAHAADALDAAPTVAADAVDAAQADAPGGVTAAVSEPVGAEPVAEAPALAAAAESAVPERAAEAPSFEGAIAEPAADAAEVTGAAEPGAPAAEAASEPPAAAPAAQGSAEAAEGPGSLGGEVVTETLADLYLAQGLLDRAVALYRQLPESQPGDARLEARLREAEERLAGVARTEGGGPGWEVVEATGRAAGTEARIEDVEAAWTGGAGADAQDVSPYVWPEDGEAAGETEAAEGPTIGE